MSSQRVVVITGGNSGMGQAMAAAFARANEHVIVIGRSEERLKATAQELGSNVTWLKADVSQRSQVEGAVADIVRQFGHVDVLINAAGFVLGVTTDLPLDEAESLWDEVVDTNLKGCFLMAVAVAPHMIRPGGRIVNISSIAAFTGGSRAGSMAYAAAKAGVLGLTYGLARELSPLGITVNAIAPGFIANTGFTGEWSEERVRGIIAETPVGRGGHVNDVVAGSELCDGRGAECEWGLAIWALSLFSFFGPRPQTGRILSVSRPHAASAPALPRSSRIGASAPLRLTSRLRSRTALPAAPPPQSSTTALNDTVRHGKSSGRAAALHSPGQSSMKQGLPPTSFYLPQQLPSLLWSLCRTSHPASIRAVSLRAPWTDLEHGRA